MADLAINMAPILGVAGKAMVATFRVFLATIMTAWAIYWARVIYRWYRK